MKYKVEYEFSYGWENSGFQTDGKDSRFNTVEEAQAEIDECVKQSNISGMGYSREEYRVVPCEYELLEDDQRLVGAKCRFGYKIPTYDDGYGRVYIHRDSGGINGIIRARSWEDAYSIVEDEFLPEASETIEELQKEYGYRREHVKIIKPLDGGPERDARSEDYPLQPNQFVRWETRKTHPTEDDLTMDEQEFQDKFGYDQNELFQESFGYRPNGPNSKDVLKHGIYAKDLNGDSLEELTEKLLEELELTLEIENE